MNGHTNGNSAIEPRDVCIVGAARTPMGSFMGSLSSLPATDLGALAIREAVKRAGVPAASIQEVIMGNVLSANLGQAPARQASTKAGLPDSVVCTTVNKVCASGMKVSGHATDCPAASMATQAIMLGLVDIAVAGGMESMSNSPFYLTKARQGYRLGNSELVDGMQKDGLNDAFDGAAMGTFAELCADEHSFSREEQEGHAVLTNERAIAAYNDGAFDWEMFSVEVKGAKGKPNVVVSKDDGLSKFNPEKLRQLRPCFKDEGTVTAGTSSAISDGAAALVLVSGAKAMELGLKVLARIRGFGDAAQCPEKFTTSPSLAIPRALAHAGLKQSAVDFFEINEAFSVVALANSKLLNLDLARVNAHGGAVALGHPLGCSGARILVTLLGVLKAKGGRIGVAGVCNGGGGASAMVIELM